MYSSPNLWYITLPFLLFYQLLIHHGSAVDYGICHISDVILGNDPEATGNITSDSYPRYIPAKAWNTNNCRQSIVACPGCRVILKFVELQLPNNCSQQISTASCLSQCDHIYLHEPDYPEQTTNYYFGKDEGAVYISRTRRVYIVYCSSPVYNSFQKRFRIQYSVEERVEKFEGAPPENGTFTSPSFPQGYSRNSDIYQYHIHNKNGYIRLTFDDWNLAPDSKITVYINNHTNTNRYLTRVGTGERPFVISSGADLLVKFETGSHDVFDSFEYMGFKARYEFVEANLWVDKPYHDCGEYYHSLAGGHVEYDGTTRCWHGDVVECLWVIFRYNDKNYDQLMLRIDSAILNEEDKLEIRRGNNSDSPVIFPTHVNIAGAEFVTDDAFYIKLQARCYENRHFKAVFASYKNATSMAHDVNGYPWYECPSTTQFACHNGRCIMKTMTCDGVNHCGDMSDEMGCTTPVSTTPVRCSTQLLCRSGEWYCIQQRCDNYIDCKDGSDELNCADTAMTPTVSTGGGSNQFFSAYHWGTIIPIILICIVLAVIACITVSYYTRRKQRHRRRRNRRSSAPASQSTGVSSVCGGLGPAAISPPQYSGPEAPPSYEESLHVNTVGNSQGVLNMGYRTDSMDYLAQPPPYTPTSDEVLPVRYVRTPGILHNRSRGDGSRLPPRATPPRTSSLSSARAVLGRLLQPIVPMYRNPPSYTTNVNNNTLPMGPATFASQSTSSDCRHTMNRPGSATSTLESRSSIGQISVISSCSSSSDSSLDSVQHYIPEQNRNPLGAHDSFCSSVEGTTSDCSFSESHHGPDQSVPCEANNDSQSEQETSLPPQNPRFQSPHLPPDTDEDSNKVLRNTNNSSNLGTISSASELKQNSVDASKDSVDPKPGDLHDDKSIEDCLHTFKDNIDITRATELLASGALQTFESDYRPQQVAVRGDHLTPASEEDPNYVAIDNQHNATYV